MSRDQVVELVAAYLDRRDEDPDLTPESYTSDLGELREEVMEAIQKVVSVNRLFGEASSAPATIGPYEVLREVGRGGMGVVYEVRRDGRTLALKLLPFAATMSPHALERFDREAGILMRLDHPGIVRCHDRGEDAVGPYLVMDLLDGQTLSDAVGRVSREEAVDVVFSLAQTLEAAHQVGVLHRDLKPQNVVLTEEGSPVLLDFGLVADPERTDLTATGDILGTPRYMAPEQVRGEATDARTDVYGLGSILYELVCGQPVHPEGSRARILSAAGKGTFTRPRELDASIPRDLCRIIDKALSAEPIDRYATAQALVDDLQRLRDGLPVRARPPALLTRAWRAARRSPERVAAAAAILLLGAAAAWGVLSRDGPALVISPKKAREAMAQALHHWLCKDDEKALAACTTALEHDPRCASADALRSRISKQDLTSPGPASQAVLDALQAWGPKDWKRMATSIEVFNALEDPDALTSYITGVSHLQINQMERAAEALLFTEKALPEPDLIAFAVGEALAKLHRGGEAEKRLRVAARRKPRSARTWYYLAEVRVGLNDGQGALEALETFYRLVKDPRRKVRRMKGRALDLLERHGEAQAIYTALVEKDPKDRRSLFALAVSYDSIHRVTQARSTYEKTLQVDPDSFKTRLYLANLLAGGDCGICAACDAAYARHPEVRDEARALELVLETISSEKSISFPQAQLLRRTALKLKNRTPVIELLEDLTKNDKRGRNTTRNLLMVLKDVKSRSTKPSTDG